MLIIAKWLTSQRFPLFSLAHCGFLRLRGFSDNFSTLQCCLTQPSSQEARNAHEKHGLVAGLADPRKEPGIQPTHAALLYDAGKGSCQPAWLRSGGRVAKSGRLHLYSRGLEGRIPTRERAADAARQDFPRHAPHFDVRSCQLREALPRRPVGGLPERHRGAARIHAAQPTPAPYVLRRRRWRGVAPVRVLFVVRATSCCIRGSAACTSCAVT